MQVDIHFVKVNIHDIETSPLKKMDLRMIILKFD